MSAEKFLLKSRAFAGMWMPVLALILQQTGAGGDVFGQVETLAECGLGAGGAIMWLWHWARPDPRKPVLKATPSLLSVVLIVGLGGGVWLGGCAGKVTPEQCQALLQIARVAYLECDRADDELEVARCYRYAEAGGAAAAILLCGFTPPPPPVEIVEVPVEGVPD